MKVVIIGAGVAGLAIGWRLRQAGAEVTVLERGMPARGATWAAAGMIAATAEHGEAKTAEAELGLRARALWRDFAREIEDASAIRVGYRQNGSVLVAVTSEELAQFRARAVADGDLRVLDATEARARVPMLAPDILGALWAPQEAQVDNRALGEALTAAFLNAGGVLSANEAAVRIEVVSGRAVAVQTPFRVLEADVFVLAAGAWSSLIEGLPPEAVPPVRPMKGEMLALAPPAGQEPPGPVVWGREVYLVPRGSELMIGATLEDAGFDTRLTDAAEDWLARRAVTLMPALRSWTIVEHWAGLRPGSPDGLPMLGQAAVQGLFIASGQHRNGILFAPVVAEILCDLVLGHPYALSAFDPRRFAGPLALPGQVD